jgi:hypothetical protein
MLFYFFKMYLSNVIHAFYMTQNTPPIPITNNRPTLIAKAVFRIRQAFAALIFLQL